MQNVLSPQLNLTRNLQQRYSRMIKQIRKMFKNIKYLIVESLLVNGTKGEQDDTVYMYKPFP